MKRLLIALVLCVVLSLPVVAQDVWIYATMFVNVAENDYSYAISNVYDQNYNTSREAIDNLWGIIEEANGGFADYLAVFGGTGYELVASISRNTELILIFKKPG